MKKLAPLEEQAPESSSAALFEISHQPDQAIVEALQQQQQATEPDVSEVEPKPAKTSKRKQQEEVVVEEAEPVKKKSSKRK
jgi:hypothetical protein